MHCWCRSGSGLRTIVSTDAPAPSASRVDENSQLHLLPAPPETPPRGDLNSHYIYRPAQLGHRELSMTQRYAHLSPDHMRAVADLTLRRPKAGLVRLSARR